MANAKPLRFTEPTPADEAVQPQVEVQPEQPTVEIKHDEFIGKDHPQFGTWIGAGWRKDH